MKGWILATAAGAVLMSSMTVSAAPSDKSAHTAPREAIYQSWSLSDQQQDQLRTADERLHERMKTLSDQDFDSAKARHQAMREAVQAHREALGDILDEQQIKVLAGLDQRAAPMRAKGQLMKTLLDSWKLDDSQRQAIDASRQQMREDLQALHDDKSATDSRDKRRQAMKEIRSQQQERLAKVLSPDQIEVLEMMRHVQLRGPMGKPPVNVARALIKSWHLDQDKMQALEKAHHDFREQMPAFKGHPKGPRGDMTPPSDAVKASDRSMDAAEEGSRDARGPRDGQRQQMAQAMKDYHQQLEEILSPVQLAALDSVTPPRGPGMKGPMGHDRDMKKQMWHKGDRDSSSQHRQDQDTSQE